MHKIRVMRFFVKHVAFSFIIQLAFSTAAKAGSITGGISGFFTDPCGAPAGSAKTCNAVLSGQYLERCLANFEGLIPTATHNPDSCTSGQCQGWRLTTRSKVLVTDTAMTQFNAEYQTQYCTNKRLHILGESTLNKTNRLPFVHVCQNAAGQVSAVRNTGTSTAPVFSPIVVQKIILNPANINLISLPSYSEGNSVVKKKITHRRVFVRAADPDGVFFVPGSSAKQNYLYSLSLKDAICTWKKFCNPDSRGLKPGVSTDGEALLPGATSFEFDHPIARLCQLDPRWHMSNEAVSCVLSQSGGIDNLCSSPDALHKNPPVGLP